MRRTAGKGEGGTGTTKCVSPVIRYLVSRVFMVSALAKKFQNDFLGKLRNIEQCQSVLRTSSVI